VTLGGAVAAAAVEETPSGPSHTGSVVLDVGGNVGAAIVYAPAGLEGVEVEIRAEHEPWTGTHKEVRPRHVAGGVLYAAVFDALPEGRYDLRIMGGDHPGAPVTVTVAGGRVARTVLSSSA
jgi:hypothetical protein